MGRNRQVYCKVCLKTMRSDHIQRHMKVHQQKGIKEEYQESTIIKRETSVSETGGNTTINKEELREILIKDNQEHDKKIDLGATIYEIIGENKIKEESLRPVNKEALNLFVKQKQCINIIKKLECNQCLKSFSLKHHLKRHIEGVHGENTFKCDYCHKAFSRGDDLNRHIKGIHQGIVFACEICNFETARKYNLKSHYELKH